MKCMMDLNERDELLKWNVDFYLWNLTDFLVKKLKIEMREKVEILLDDVSLSPEKNGHIDLIPKPTR